MAISKEKLGIVHIAKQQLGLSESEYRSILHEAAGVGSARHLDEEGFERVLVRFESLGFLTLRQQRSYGHRSGMATPAQIEYIRGLWQQYTDGQDEGLERWIENKFRVSSLRFLDTRAAGNVLTALKAMVNRRNSA